MANNIITNRALLFGLIVECPMGKPLPDCIMKPHRQTQLKDADERIDKLPEYEVEHLIQCCHNGLKRWES